MRCFRRSVQEVRRHMLNLVNKKVLVSVNSFIFTTYWVISESLVSIFALNLFEKTDLIRVLALICSAIASLLYQVLRRFQFNHGLRLAPVLHLHLEYKAVILSWGHELPLAREYSTVMGRSTNRNFVTST